VANNAALGENRMHLTIEIDAIRGSQRQGEDPKKGAVLH
jgi:hypothetical protein